MFKRTAKVPVISISEAAYDTASDKLVFNKVAGDSKQASVFQQDPNRIKIRALLEMVAEEYDISPNPHDYIFEAVRAVTAEVPNENGDSFPKDELLRFDHRLSKAIYQTFVGKPHHINHRADNPKTSRGVVLDASYNDLTPALDNCPNCNNRTAEIEGRDKSGVNCIKCGSTVKDEFVELLLAVDTKKDPTFAAGVKNGALDSLSMGCEAGYTDCSICDNRARTVAQFCQHIKSGNKKKMFKTASGMKMSYEKCGEVIFTEISRVDQPADPTAKQKEIFTASIPLSVESEMLVMASKISKLEHMVSKVAQTDQVSNKEGQVLENVQEELKESLEPLKVMHPEVAPLLEELSDGNKIPEPMSMDDYVKEKQEDVDKNVTPAELGMKMEEGGLPVSITAKVLEDKIASELDALVDSVKENNVTTEVMAYKFANSYKDLEATVTKSGNVKIHNKHGTLFVVRPDPKPADKLASEKVATEVLSSIADNGIVSTVMKYQTVVGPKMAQVLEHHLEDFKDGREEGDKKGMPEGGDDDMADERGKPEKSLVKEEHTDRADMVREQRDQTNSDVLEKHQPDHKEVLPTGYTPAAAEEHSDMADGHGKPAKSTLSDITVDFKDKQPKSAQMATTPGAPAAPSGAPMSPAPASHACGCVAAADCHCPPDCACLKDHKQAQDMGEMPMDMGEMPMDMGGMPMVGSKEDTRKYTTRLERLYKGRIEKAQSDAAQKVADTEKTVTAKVTNKFLRALKLAAKRQALNLEFSPIKASFCDVLTSQLDVDADSFYPGMDPATATSIIEAAVDSGFDQFVESLVRRATDLMAMNDESLVALESDIQNLRPASMSVTASMSKAAAREDIRAAAMSGNLVVAPSPTDETISNGKNRDNIRSALGSTKVRRTSQALLKGD